MNAGYTENPIQIAVRLTVKGFSVGYGKVEDFWILQYAKLYVTRTKFM